MTNKFTHLSRHTAFFLIVSIIGVSVLAPYQKAEAVGSGVQGCISSLIIAIGIDKLKQNIKGKVTGAIGGVLSNAVPISNAGIDVTAEQTSDLREKELVQNTAIRKCINAFTQEITNSIVVWINNGFEGSPTFIENPGEFFGDLADQTAGFFIEGAGLDFLCSPFKLDIQIGLRNSYSGRDDYRSYCTPSRIAQVAKYTSDDFNDVGWDGWLDLTTHDENNVYGSWVSANNSMNNAINSRVNTELKKLDWGNGFHSITDSETGLITTPGSIIVKQADRALGSNLATLETAKEIDDILSALLNQLMNQVISKGLKR
ncbi:MAG: hypothetical protein ABI430_03390 [Candidatus Taylorbacteria bacterium]